MRKTILIGVHLFLQEKEIKSSHLFVLILSWICGRPRSKLIIFDTNLRLVQILFYQGSCVTAPIRRTDFIPRITCIESACPLRYQIPLNNILYNMYMLYTIYILNRSGIFACTLRRFTLRRYSAQLCYVWNRVTSNLRNSSSKIRQPREFVGKPYGVCSYPNIQQRKIPRGEEIVS